MTDTPRKQYVAPSHFCAACRARGKTWEGSDPRCAFPDGGPFTSDNWNCATAGAIRDLIGDYPGKPRPGVHRDYAGDQTYATVRLDADSATLEDVQAHALYVSWYKSRGRTGAMLLMGDEDWPTRPPTETEALAILKYYGPEETQARRDWWHKHQGPGICPY